MAASPDRGPVARRFGASPSARTGHRLSLTLGVLSFLLVGALWEIVGRSTTNTIFFVPLSAVGFAIIKMAGNGELWSHLSASLTEFALGFLIACAVGIITGTLMSVHWAVRDFLEPWVAALYTVPIIALGPLFIIWWGIGLTAKVIIVMLVAVFPIILNTYMGVALVESQLVEVARSFGATPLQVYAKVRFPAAVPSIITGLRIALRGALVAVVVAELFGSRAGLGYLVLTSAQSFQTADLFVGVLTLSALGIVGFQLLRVVEGALTPWLRVGLER